jgi:RimJ/RimL family protein N-acetyltransferase
MLVRSATAGTLRPGFGIYQIHDGASELVVGDIGFHGPPDAEGVIEIGYGIAPKFRGRGIASHALRLLSAWALKQPDVAAIVARTEVDYEASRRVLEMAGFQWIDARDGVCRYRRLRPSSGSGVA